MHYVYLNIETCQRKVDNYVAMYGFLRAMALITCFLFDYLLIDQIKYSCHIVKVFGMSNCVINWKCIGILVVILIVANLLYMGFVKFYRRFTLENYMALLTEKPWKANNRIFVANVMHRWHKAVPSRTIWRDLWLVRQPYSVAVPSTGGRLHPLPFWKGRGLGSGLRTLPLGRDRWGRYSTKGGYILSSLRVSVPCKGNRRGRKDYWREAWWERWSLL